MDLKQYRSKLIGSDDEQAVSPVIGVILMVAITVILAAVIAAFVLDMGPSGESVQASVSIDGDETDEVDIGIDDGGSADYLVIVEAGTGVIADADGGSPSGAAEEANTGATYTVHSTSSTNDNDDFLGGTGEFSASTDYEVWAVTNDLSGGDSLDSAEGSVQVAEFTLS